MDDLNDLALFALVVEHGGFAAVERATGIPKSRLSRRVAELERSFGARLLQRSTRRFAVTEVGRQVFQHAQAMRAEADAARDAVAMLSSEPRGVVRVSCPVALAQQQLACLLPDFLRRYPRVDVLLQVSNRRVDVMAESIDVALRVRNDPGTEGGLVVRRFGAHGMVLVASTQYLDARGRPAHPDDLARHAILSLMEEPGVQRWELRADGGETVQVEFQPRVAAKDFPLLRALAEQGLGIALLPEFTFARAPNERGLEHVLPGWNFPQGICHAAFASRRGMLPAVRAFIDYLAETLPPLLAEDHAACANRRPDS